MIFIDAGFWEGRALEIYKQKGLVDDSWTIYAFEPNPVLDVQHDIDRIGLPVKFIKKAVWTEDGRKTFKISGRPDAASLTGTSGHGDSQIVRVQTIDFSKFVSNLPNEPIICNMDIEGAEFFILPKMIEDGSIDKIDILEVEFHHRLMADYEKSDSENIITELYRHNVKVIIKVPL